MRVHAFYITLLIIAGAVIFYMVHQLDKASQAIDSKESIIKEQKSELAEHRNNEGRLVVEKSIAIADLKSIQESYPKLIADVIKKLGIKPKAIVGALQADIQVTGSGKVKIKPDTIKVAPESKEGHPEPVGIVDISDGYLKLKGTIHADVIDYVDYSYSYNDTLLLTVDKSKSFFKGETWRISGVLQNPNAQIVKTTGVVVHEIKPKRFNISVGIYYDPLKGQFGPAVTAGYSLVRF